MPQPLLHRKPKTIVPNWSWEEHGDQDFQRAEHAEHGFGAAMLVVALMIVVAVALRLALAYAHLGPF
jgi:hypothetical protein